jgi:hypothetical protein
MRAATFDDGSGEALYAGGKFSSAGGMAAKRIARWDGTSWSALGSGMDGGFWSRVLALAGSHVGQRSALYAGGDFESAPDSGDSYLARWACPFQVTEKSKVRRR